VDRGRGQGARQSAGGPAGRLGRRVYRERAVGDRLRLTIEPFKRRGLVCRGGLNVLSATIGLTERGRAAAKVLAAAGATVDNELTSRVGPKDIERARRVLFALVDIGRKTMGQAEK
jgi:hypothetical protein